MPGTSVIVSTYNQPANLGFVLLALARQSIMPEEVLVADDGSGPETARTLQELGRELPCRLVHVWQPDESFRLARSRNNAIHAAGCDAIAFLDQDTIPHRDWLENHMRGMGPGRMCTGYVLRLDEKQSAGLNANMIRSGAFESLHAPAERRRLDALQRKYVFYCLARRIRLGIKGRPATAFGNSCANKADLVRVNGFDEEYVGWGQEDDDLGWRLFMAGIRPVPAVNRALVTHVWHPRRRHEEWSSGSNIERYRRKRASYRCEKGLADHPHADVAVTVVNGR